MENDKLSCSEQIRLILCYILQIPIGTWMILYQAVLPLLEQDNINLSIVYYYSGIFLLQILTGIYSFSMITLKMNKVTPKVMNRVNIIAIIISMIMTIIGCILLGYGNNDNIRGFGLMFVIAPSPIYLICSMIVVVPSILKKKSDNVRHILNHQEAVNVNSAFNLYGIMAGLMSLTNLTLSQSCIITIIGSIVSGIYLIININTPDDICDDGEYSKIFEYNDNIPFYKKIILLLLTIYGTCTVIVPWTANYNSIVAAALGVPKNDPVIQNIIELYTNYWTWASPITVVIISKIFERICHRNIMYEIFVLSTFVSIVCIGISTKTSLIIWGFIDSSLPVTFFGSTMLLFIEQFKGGVLVQSLFLFVAGIVNYTSLLKTNIYSDPNKYLILTMTEGTIVLILSIMLLRKNS
jgi:hypothetical protein